MRLRPIIPLLALSAACAKQSGAPSADSSSAAAALPPNVTSAAQAINADSLLQHIKDLSADSMEGRGPGTAGETKTVAYLTRQFQALGLQPGNPDGTWVQNVDLIGYTSKPTGGFTVAGKPMPLAFPDDYVMNSRHDRASTKIDASDVVFVGYGVVAPEYGWDDYKGVDVKGKTILMLVNDPAVPDTTLFRGKAMTYYGRWTYKYEIATQKGAAAAIIIHETGPAGYPYEVVKGSYSAEQFDVPSADAGKRVGAEGWITSDKARALFAAAGQNFDSLKAAAIRTDFKPVPIAAKATFDVKIAVRRVQSKNVVAKLAGTSKADEYVIYSAHWDHLGRDTTAKGDQIFNGAVDNASGTAGLLELARAFKAAQPAPARSILFLAVTAEEKGLVGAKYYASHPLHPLAKTVADLNIDELNPWGRTSDLTVVGLGNSSLDDVLTRVLAADKRTVTPDPSPEKGFYYRSDHFEFAKQGVPALFVNFGTKYEGAAADSGTARHEWWETHDYHNPSDEVRPWWDLSGAAADLRAMFAVGYLVANDAAMPTWKRGTEFKAKRDSMLARR